ncbi:MAG: hypothetical protein K6E47_17445 [Lachnospiraceae bacterium]|nr:hypothetical protein [Lachnospiraceae bacterium]
MKRGIAFILCFIISITCILANSTEVNAKTKEKTYKEKYCKQVKKITTNSLEKMTPEKFSYSFIDMKSIATLKGPKYNSKTKNYDDRKYEYVRIDVKKDGTLTFSGDGEYLPDAPYGMQNFQFGFFLDEDFNVKNDEKREIFKYSGGQYIGKYYSSDEYCNSSNPNGFSKLSRAYCKDEAFSIEVKKGETVYIGCGQNSFNLRACFVPGNSSSAEIISGDEELVFNLLTVSECIEGDIEMETGDSIEISVKYGKKTYKQLIIPVNYYEDEIEDDYDYDYGYSEFVDIKKYPKYEEYAKKYNFDKYDEVKCYDASYGLCWRVFSIAPKGIDFGSKIKLTVKTSSGRQYSLTRKLIGDYIRRPDGLDEGSYNYKKHTLTGRCSGESIIKFQYRGKEYSTKVVSSFIGTYEYSYTFPVNFKPGKKMKITVIKDGEERTAIFRT